jgi:hypothetical protein
VLACWMDVFQAVAVPSPMNAHAALAASAPFLDRRGKVRLAGRRTVTGAVRSSRRPRINFGHLPPGPAHDGTDRFRQGAAPRRTNWLARTTQAQGVRVVTVRWPAGPVRSRLSLLVGRHPPQYPTTTVFPAGASKAVPRKGAGSQSAR